MAGNTVGRAISIRLRYEAKSKLGQVHGNGQTKMMSTKDIIFAPGDRLAPGMDAEIVFDWRQRLARGGIEVIVVAHDSHKA